MVSLIMILFPPFHKCNKTLKAVHNSEFKGDKPL